MKRVKKMNVNGSKLKRILRLLRAETWCSYQGIIGIVLLILAVLALLQFLWLTAIILLIASTGWIRADILDREGMLPKGDLWEETIIDQ